MKEKPDKSKSGEVVKHRHNMFGCLDKTAAIDMALVEVGESELDSVMTVVNGMGLEGRGVEQLAVGAFKEIGCEQGELTDRGLRRVMGAVKFLGGLLAGKKHKVAMEESGLAWNQVNAFMLACPEFEKVYMAARGKMKMAMGMTVLDTALELAVEGSDVYYKGEVVGKKKSEKMLDKLLVLAGGEFAKDGGRSASQDSPGKGGIVLNFHFDGKNRAADGEAIDV